MSGKRAAFGIILILIGLLLLGRTFDVFYFTFGQLFRLLLPTFLILLGIWLIFRRRRVQERFEQHAQTYTHTSPGESAAPAQAPPDTGQSATNRDHAHPPPPPPPPSDEPSSSSATQAPRREDGKLKYSKIIGDMRIDFRGMRVENVEVSSGIGDLEMNLGGVQLAAGLNRVIVSGFIGDVRIYVPRDLNVFANCSNFAGEVEVLGRRSGGFGNNIDGQSEGYETADRRLYIAANNFLGDVRVILT